MLPGAASDLALFGNACGAKSALTWSPFVNTVFARKCFFIKSCKAMHLFEECSAQSLLSSPCCFGTSARLRVLEPAGGVLVCHAMPCAVQRR